MIGKLKFNFKATGRFKDQSLTHGLSQFAVLALRSLQFLGDIDGNAGTLAAVNFGLFHPGKQRVRRAADFGGNRLAGLPQVSIGIQKCLHIGVQN